NFLSTHHHRIKPRLANPSFKPQKHHILAAVDNFVDLLKIRYSSPLFRLRTANAIQERLHFHNTGPPWVQGIIVMSIEDGDAEKPGMAQIDPFYSLVVVLFNVCPAQVSLEIPALKSRTLQLHPVQLNSVDDVVKQSAYDASSCSFIIPQRTTSLFVELRNTWINLLFSLSLLLFFFNSKIIMC
ncbi:pullulanase 1, chloroplastic-like, partial [Zingiber officinale]|uniref:pullulanase 1, chloroplastic-like n=1 Tax=Zingiber officinale TaxID=94328 RepID=UPI001C4C58CD